MTSVTIRDISELAGVSPATVSRVLGHKGNVSPKAEMNVMRAAHVLGYRTDGIINPGTDRFLVIVPNLESTGAEILSGIEAAAQKHGKFAVVISANLLPEGSSTESLLPDVCAGCHVDGIIICGNIFPDESLLSISHRPLVVTGGGIGGVNTAIHTVGTDEYAAARDATAYLVSKGFTRIGLSTRGVQSAEVRLREKGCRDMLSERGLSQCACRDAETTLDISDSIHSDFFVIQQHKREQGYAAACKLFRIISAELYEPLRTVVAHSLVIKRQKT